MRPATLAVHAGRPPRDIDQPLNVPITMASTYVAGGDLEYGRYANPTWTAFEDALGRLEDGRCLAFASGLAVVSTVLDLVGAGETVVAPRHAYNGTTTQLADLEARGRARALLVDIADTDAVVAACADAALVWIESPTNPAMEIADIPAIAAAAHEAGARVVVDNTFATPLLQQPLDLGADLVVHSATKYLSGHADLVMGAAVTRDDELHDVLKGRRDLAGAIPGAFEAWLAHRSLATLAVRLERQEANAAALAEALRTRDDVTDVRWPGVGSVLCFTLEGADRAQAFLGAATLVAEATSFGGLHSTAERRARWGTDDVAEGWIRFSCGIEDTADVLADVFGALDATGAATAGA